MHELTLAPAEFSVRAGVMDIPGELLGEDVDLIGLFWLRKLHLDAAPGGDRVEDDEGDLEDHHDDVGDEAFERAMLCVALSGDSFPPSVLDQEVGEENAPQDEDREHRDMDQDDPEIDFVSVGGRRNR